MEKPPTILRVTQFGEPILREKGEAVQAFDKDLKQLADLMFATMYAHEGIGLAAQQIGEALMFCVVDLQMENREVDFDFTLDGRRIPLDLIMPMPLANPVVEVLPSEKLPYDEGCLSFPDIRAEVIRNERIRCTYQDLSGAKHVLETGGLLARVIQHEVDHLNGILFIDRMDRRAKSRISTKVKKLERSTRKAMEGK